MLEFANEMKLLKLGTVCLDGTKIHANASRHSALSHGHIGKLEVQLEAEVAQLFALAESAAQANVPDGVSLPEEIKRRQDRLAAMAGAKNKIAERHAREQAEYEQKMAARAAKNTSSTSTRLTIMVDVAATPEDERDFGLTLGIISFTLIYFQPQGGQASVKTRRTRRVARPTYTLAIGSNTPTKRHWRNSGKLFSD